MLSVIIALFSECGQDSGISCTLLGENLVQTVTWKPYSEKPSEPFVLKSFLKNMRLHAFKVWCYRWGNKPALLIKRIFIFCNATIGRIHLPGCQAIINFLVYIACLKTSMEPSEFFSLKWILKALCYCLVLEKYWQGFSFSLHQRHCFINVKCKRTFCTPLKYSLSIIHSKSQRSKRAGWSEP